MYITNGGGAIQLGNGGIHNGDSGLSVETTVVDVGSGRSLAMNGTTVIDSSRNLTNVGTLNGGTPYTTANDTLLMHKGADIPGSVDLNNYTANGFYHQNSNSNATSGSNYPASAAGMLTVTADGAMVYQTYHQYNGNNYYFRSYYNGTWYGWRKLYHSGTGDLTVSGLVTADRFYSGLGTAASPAFQVGDTNTGFYDSGANTIGVACNGGQEFDFGASRLDMKQNRLDNVSEIRIVDTNTKLNEGAGNSVRIQTNNGYVDIGAMNSSYCHLQTDRGNFYFNKRLTVDEGIVQSYDEDLQLRRASSSTNKLTIGSGHVSTPGYLRGSRLYSAADGGSGYFYNDTSTRTAYAGGDFYIQTSVGNYYNYATNQYMGNTSGDTIYVRGNRMTHNGWDMTASGHIIMYDSKHIRFGTGGDCEFFCNGSHMYIDLNSGIGNLYIRDGSTTRYTFNDNGSFTATGNITAYSDRRVKDRFEPITSALSKVQQLHGQTYVRTDMDDDNRRYAGLIAQDVEAVLPEAVTEIEDHLALDYSGTIALLVEAIKELKTEVNDLKAQLEER
jgi:hypothetical protein